MRKLAFTISLLIAFSALFAVPQTAFCNPDLMLFIPEPYGYYDDDPEVESWVTLSDEFMLQAIVDDNDIFNGNSSVDLYLCVALSDDLYTFDGNGDVVVNPGINIEINGSPLPPFEHGLPPIAEEDGGGGDLAPHGVYPTAFTEVVITIDDTGSFPATYDFWVTGAVPGIHFDLYTVNPDGSLAAFAPFSKDAETIVPEPSTLALLGTGFILLPAGRYIRRKRSKG